MWTAEGEQDSSVLDQVPVGLLKRTHKAHSAFRKHLRCIWPLGFQSVARAGPLVSHSTLCTCLGLSLPRTLQGEENKNSKPTTLMRMVCILDGPSAVHFWYLGPF